MPRALSLFLLLTLAACARFGVDGPTAHGDSGDAWAEASAERRGQVTVLYVPAEGFAYRDASGALTGVTADLMRAFEAWVAEEQGVALATAFVEEPDWRTFYGRVRDAEGGVFGIGNVTITEARRAEIAFSPPYLHNVAVLITPAAVPEITPADAPAGGLAGLDALAFEGTLHEDRLRAFRQRHAPEAPLAFANSNAAILDRVAAGEAFAYVDGYNFWRAEAEGVPVRRHPAFDDAAETFGVILPLGSDWAEPLAAFVAEYRASEAYEASLRRHLGDRVAEVLLEAAR